MPNEKIKNEFRFDEEEQPSKYERKLYFYVSPEDEAAHVATGQNYGDPYREGDVVIRGWQFPGEEQGMFYASALDSSGYGWNWPKIWPVEVDPPL